MGTAERVGGGLVDISAVATIVGAPVAEALIHGLKAACGMAWAPTGCFGAIHVTKACLSASVPDQQGWSMTRGPLEIVEMRPPAVFLKGNPRRYVMFHISAHAFAVCGPRETVWGPLVQENGCTVRM
jgi:hypothetical protein